ncbi:histidine kinase G7 [Halenospora varia]|nr:histidine kinase G7 [Halenospora varia]
MPVRDGVASTRETRRFEKANALPRVRIIALTCFSSDEYRHNAFAAGVDMFLVKPIRMKNLKAILDMNPDEVVSL